MSFREQLLTAIDKAMEDLKESDSKIYALESEISELQEEIDEVYEKSESARKERNELIKHLADYDKEEQKKNGKN